ncbi:hypothetical protein FA13DRAFT_353134 [Coprinellus micaceus]|uniref:Uncharacterized protein n=1 Tax=Coprinellus micaceus TaxID=71717 RepID=A0A4Y7TAP4_COPMI|nr:hypothetical protein FA13DRAFT_353134 [Coprinellus micaceus]
MRPRWLNGLRLLIPAYSCVPTNLLRQPSCTTYAFPSTMSTIDRLAAARRQREQEMEMARFDGPRAGPTGAPTPARPQPGTPVGGGENTFLAEVHRLLLLSSQFRR